MTLRAASIVILMALSLDDPSLIFSNFSSVSFVMGNSKSISLVSGASN